MPPGKQADIQTGIGSVWDKDPLKSFEVTVVPVF